MHQRILHIKNMFAYEGKGSMVNSPHFTADTEFDDEYKTNQEKITAVK
jgi:hypothetical protein